MDRFGLARRGGLLLVAMLVLSGCGAAGVATPPGSGGRSIEPVEQFPDLAFTVDPSRIERHLDALMAVAIANDGVRTVGTPGYEASVDYAASELRDLGFRVETPEVPFPTFRETPGGRLEIGARTYAAPDDLHALIYSASGDVSAPIHLLDRSGCDRTDFDGFPDGSIAVTSVGGCLRRTQVMNAEAAGAPAIIMVYPNRGPGQILRPTLISPNGIDIPAVSVSDAVGRALDGADGRDVHLVIATERASGTLRNVVAELGSGDRVVMAGGHLDSVVDGPGINDNGSGVSALLEVARGVAEVGVPAGATVRIALWGGEEFGLLGSTAYVGGLDAAARGRIVAYLNLDMVGSPNGITFIYAPDGEPRGSGAITIDYEVWFEDRGLPAEREDLGGSSDHYAFGQAGIPVGGLFSGATEVKTTDQAAEFGGTSGAAMDSCYHLACDITANVDLDGSATMAGATLAVLLRVAAP